jgi:DNA-directed RNA polymerase subunit RPC12/RpoP
MTSSVRNCMHCGSWNVQDVSDYEKMRVLCWDCGKQSPPDEQD